MKRNVKIIIAVILASVLAVTGAVLVTRSQLKATDAADVSYAVQDETTESVTVVELVGEITDITEAAEENTEEALNTEETDADPEIQESEDEEPVEPDEESEIPETSEEEEVEGRYSYITTNLDGAEEVSFGMEVILTLNLEGYEDVPVKIQWQYSMDGETWFNIEGADGMTYSFILSEYNYEYYWRADVAPLN